MSGRLTDWRPRLVRYLGWAARTPFRPGTLDCALFGAGGVEAILGRDPAAALRGRYTTLSEGYAMLREMGHEDHIAMAAAEFSEVAPSLAWPGDLAVVETAEGPALGIMQGQMVYVMARSGMGLEPRAAAMRAFRVA